MKRFTFFSLMVFWAGVVIRVIAASQSVGFWSDELTAIYFSKIPLSDAILRDNSGPAFQILLRIWISVFGNSEMAIKLLPCMLSCGSLVLLYFMNLPLVLLGLAVSPFSVAACTQVKSTSLFELISLGYILFFIRNFLETDKPSPKSWIYFILLSFLYSSVHYLSTIVIFVFTAYYCFKQLKGIFRILALAASTVVLFLIGDNSYWIINYSHLGFLKEKNLGSYWQRGQLFSYLQSTESTNILFLVAGFFIGLFFKKVRRNSTFQIFSATLFVYIFLSEWLAYSIFEPRYLTPVTLLLVITVFTSMPKMQTYFGLSWPLGFASVLFFLTARSVLLKTSSADSWKFAANELCQERAIRPLAVWGTSGLRYYFPDSCAEVRYFEDDMSSFCGYVLIPTQYVVEFASVFEKFGHVHTVKKFGPKTIEPLTLLRKPCSEYK